MQAQLDQDTAYSVEPFYFGTASGALYGCYHRPKRQPARRHGVLLCSPVGQEYIQSHRALYQLAERLAGLGIHVLRFDYLGCGDSAGDFEQGSMEQWAADVRTAFGALRQRMGEGSQTLLGLRLGATLAVHALAQGIPEQLANLVLWEPIVDGFGHVRELLQRHQSFVAQIRGGGSRRETSGREVLGFPLTEALRHRLETMVWPQRRLPSGLRLLAICNHQDGWPGDEKSQVMALQTKAQYQQIADHQVWAEELYKRLLPIATMNNLVQWIDKASQ